jgi:hypothetical protein
MNRATRAFKAFAVSYIVLSFFLWFAMHLAPYSPYSILFLGGHYILAFIVFSFIFILKKERWWNVLLFGFLVGAVPISLDAYANTPGPHSWLDFFWLGGYGLVGAIPFGLVYFRKTKEIHPIQTHQNSLPQKDA